MAKKAVKKEEDILSQEALRKSEYKYRTIFESIDYGFCIIEVLFDNSGKANNYNFLETNPAFTKLTFLQDTLATSMKEVKPKHEDYWINIFGEVAKTGESRRFEHFASQLGEGTWYDVFAFRIDEPEKNHVAMLFNDISDRKSSDQRLAFILKLSDALRPIANSLTLQETAMNLLGTSLKVNRAFYAEVFDDSDMLVLGPGYVHDVFPLEGRLSISAVSTDMINHQYQMGETVVINNVDADDRFSAESREGFTSAYVKAAVGVPLVKEGKIVAILSVHQSKPRDWKLEEIKQLEETAELTWASVERAKAEEALRKSEEQLRHFNLSLEQEVEARTKEIANSKEELYSKNKQLNYTIAQLESFNYLASHDLQEPLRKIQTFVALMKENEHDHQKYLAGIHEAAARMTQLIDDLLSYSRISQAVDAFQQVNLNEILEFVKKDFEFMITEKGAIIVQDKLPVIRAIPVQMNQLFTNLLSNALKFNTGKPEIRITSRIIAPGNIIDPTGNETTTPYVEIKVADNGIGFDNRYNKKIFELFQRLHGKAEFQGTGIGLSIVEKIVKNHHGFIQAHGETNKGAEFIIWLPIE